jgi:hypothetical protein
VRPIPDEEAGRAYDDWGANCGPGALAAIMDMTLDAVRPHLIGFDQKRYTNPTMMFDALRSLKAVFEVTKPGRIWPDNGLARVQWDGPWTEPSVPARVAYRHTHWVATHWNGTNYGIFDINATANGSGWCSMADWCGTIAPWIMKELVPKSTGRWHLTHSIEIERGQS